MVLTFFSSFPTLSQDRPHLTFFSTVLTTSDTYSSLYKLQYLSSSPSLLISSCPLRDQVVPSTLCAIRFRFSCVVLSSESSRVHTPTSFIVVSPPYVVFSFHPLYEFLKPRSLPLSTVWLSPVSVNIVFVTVVYLLQAEGVDKLHFSVFVVNICA